MFVFGRVTVERRSNGQRCHPEQNLPRIGLPMIRLLYMFSFFPELFDWSFYVPFVFRIILGLYLLDVSFIIVRSHLEKHRGMADWTYIFSGVLIALLAGCYFFGIAAQIVGVIGFITAALSLWLKYQKHPLLTETYWSYALFGILALSLLFLGPGPYSFDLPL